MLIMNWFGASGGVDLLHASTRSLRTTVSSSNAIRPVASATICTTLALGRRCRLVTAKRQLGARLAPRTKRSDIRASQPINENTAKPPANPAAVSGPGVGGPAGRGGGPGGRAGPGPGGAAGGGGGNS